MIQVEGMKKHRERTKQTLIVLVIMTKSLVGVALHALDYEENNPPSPIVVNYHTKKKKIK